MNEKLSLSHFDSFSVFHTALWETLKVWGEVSNYEPVKLTQCSYLTQFRALVSLYLHLTIKPFNDTALRYNVARILLEYSTEVEHNHALSMPRSLTAFVYWLYALDQSEMLYVCMSCMSIKRRTRLRPWVTAFLFLFQAFAGLRHRQSMLRKHSTIRKIKAMKVIRIIGIRNKDNEFPNVTIVSIYESYVNWQLLLTRFRGRMY